MFYSAPRVAEWWKKIAQWECARAASTNTLDINIKKRMSHSSSFIQHNHMSQKLVKCSTAPMLHWFVRWNEEEVKLQIFWALAPPAAAGCTLVRLSRKTSTKFLPAPRKSHFKHKKVRKDKILRDCEDLQLHTDFETEIESQLFQITNNLVVIFPDLF